MIFRSVARAGSISRAARELGWTQPAVSQHLSALEREAGTSLLLRGSHGVTLTEAGRLLLARADAVAGELHMADEELAAVAQLRRGKVRLAAYPSALATVVPRAVAALRSRYPEVDVTLVDAEPPQAIQLLEENTVDLALIFGYDSSTTLASGLRWQPIGDEAVHLLVPPHGGYEHQPSAIGDLVNAPWIVGCQRCRRHLLDLCRRAGFEPIERHTTDDYVVRQNLVAAGLGVTLLPEAALTAHRHPGVVVRTDPSFGRRRFGVAFRDGADRVPANLELLKELRTGLAARVNRSAGP